MTPGFLKHHLQEKISTLQENLKAIDAEIAGKRVQRRCEIDGEWEDVTSVEFPFSGQYRVKPEPPKPRVRFFHEYEDGILSCSHYASELEAREARDWAMPSHHRVVKFVEVMELAHPELI